MREDEKISPNPDRGGGHGKKEEQVHFTHLSEREKANFKVKSDRTLQSIWDEAYRELDVAKTDRDVLQAPRKKGNPVSLMGHLGLTLDEAQGRDLCEKDFEIAAGTGGA